MAEEKWIQGAIKKPGALTQAAKRDKMTPLEYAYENKDASGVTGKRARLAITLSKLNKK